MSRQPNESDEEYQQQCEAVAQQEHVPSLDQTEWQQGVVAKAMPEVDGQTEGKQKGRDLDITAYKYDSGGESEGEGGYIMVHVPAYIYGQSLISVPEDKALVQYQVPPNPEDKVF